MRRSCVKQGAKRGIDREKIVKAGGGKQLTLRAKQGGGGAVIKEQLRIKQVGTRECELLCYEVVERGVFETEKRL